MIALLDTLARDDSGSAMVEYALILSLISMLSYAALMAVGGALEQFFISSSSGLSAVATNPQ